MTHRCGGFVLVLLPVPLDQPDPGARWKYSAITHPLRQALRLTIPVKAHSQAPAVSGRAIRP